MFRLRKIIKQHGSKKYLQKFKVTLQCFLIVSPNNQIQGNVCIKGETNSELAKFI